MMLARINAKFFHTNPIYHAVEKSLLAALRKKTGYTFSNCKKALELHNNNLQQAEEWLKKQAQELGWSKATKLEGRQTLQGLVGVGVTENKAALVEVNCETDFVARNDEFKKMVEAAVKTCLAFINTHKLESPVTKIYLTSEDMKKMISDDGKSLGDKMALMIGTVGENATLRRGLCIKTSDDLSLTAYAHPASVENQSPILLGRLAGVVALKSTSNESEGLEDVSKGICQHIVGMAPKKIGNSDDKPATNKEEEVCLIHQEYLLDDSLTVKDILEQNQVSVVDFSRFECGESTISDQPLDLVETCQ